MAESTFTRSSRTDSASRLATSPRSTKAAWKKPLLVVHGGGREIDAALSRAGIPKRQVDGVRRVVRCDCWKEAVAGTLPFDLEPASFLLAQAAKVSR